MSILKLWESHGTKVLGYIQMAIPALLAISDLIPSSHVKYWLAAGVLLGGLTVQRGHQNSARIEVNRVMVETAKAQDDKPL